MPRSEELAHDVARPERPEQLAHLVNFNEEMK